MLQRRMLRGGVLAVAALMAACGSDNSNGGTGGSSGSGGSAGGGGGGGAKVDGGVDAAVADAARSDGPVADAAKAADGSTDAALPVTAATTCKYATDLTKPIAMPVGREVICAIDLGSNSAKLSIMSWVKGMPDTLKDERPCANKLGLGNKAYDSAKLMPLTVPQADVDNLILVVKQFQQLCTLDVGRMVGGDATQWARDALNSAAIFAAIKAQTTLDIQVLTPTEEGLYGYMAATYNKPGKIDLDPGSNSFQIAFQRTTDPSPLSVSVPVGYVRAGKDFFSDDASNTTYDMARTKYLAKVRGDLETALGGLTPPMSLAMLKAAVAANTLSKEVFLPGQDGAILYGINGKLKPMGTWIPDKPTYDATVAMNTPVASMVYPGFTSGTLAPMVLATWVAGVQPADFMTLRTNPVRDLYGDKLMANAALLDLVATELGLTNVVFVPQEISLGYAIAKAK